MNQYLKKQKKKRNNIKEGEHLLIINGDETTILNRIELYLLLQSGEMIFYLNASETETDSSKLLTASYLTGILQFAKAASGELISNFELGKLDIWLKVGSELPLYYVYIVGKNVKIKRKKIEKHLSNIIQEFESRYTKDEMTSWDGDLNAFDEFLPTAKKVLGLK